MNAKLAAFVRATLQGRVAAWAAGVAAVVGIAAVVAMLIPSGLELASLRADAGRDAEALQLLERRVADGDTSPAALAALAHARSQHGDAAGALTLLQALVEHHSGDPALLQAFGEALIGAGRSAEAVAVLERAYPLQPVTERRRAISRLIVVHGTSAQQFQALRALVERDASDEVAEHLELARRLAEGSDPAGAIAVRERMVERFPASLDASVVGAQMRAELALGAADAALARAERWLRRRGAAGLGEAPMLAAVLGGGGRHDLAAALLAPRLEAAAPPSLLAAWAQAEAAAGRADVALGRLEAAPAPGDPALLPLRLALALDVGPIDRALDAARQLGIATVPAPLLQRLAEQLVSAGHRDGAAWLYHDSAATLAQHDPLLAGRLAWAAGQRDAALRWAEAANAAPRRDAAAALPLARLLEQLGRRDDALAVLRRAVGAGLPDALRDEAARLYIALGHAREGLDALAAPDARPANDDAWALLATAAGHGNVVLGWLTRRGAEATPHHVLRDLLHLGVDAGAPGLAVLAAERLGAECTPADRYAQVRALLASGRSAQALALLRSSAAADPQQQLAILEAAHRAGEPVAGELRRIALAQLAASPPPALRDAAIAALQTLGDAAALVPVLEPLATSEPQRWLGLYTETALRAGASDRLAALWRRLGDDVATAPVLRRQVAFRLLEAGDKAAAERVFRTLAADAAPNADPTSQLLYVWGPRPPAAGLDWLAVRAERARDNTEAAAWLRHLVERGGADRVAALVPRIGSVSGREPLVDIWVDAVTIGGSRSALVTTLREAATQTRSPALLGRFAQLAGGLGDALLERRLLESAFAAGASEPALRRRHALLVWQAGEFDVARRHLERLRRDMVADAETLRVLGEIVLRQEGTAAARGTFIEALAALDRGGPRDHAAQRLRAGLLLRLARGAEALALYEQLLAERPDDDALRADYVSMLLDRGERARAAAALTRS